MKTLLLYERRIVERLQRYLSTNNYSIQKQTFSIPLEIDEMPKKLNKTMNEVIIRLDG